MPIISPTCDANATGGTTAIFGAGVVAAKATGGASALWAAGAAPNAMGGSKSVENSAEPVSASS